MVRKTKEEAERTRQAILDSALEVILDKGFSATSMDQIAKQAGLTRGAIYWHFKNKTALFEEILTDWLAPANALVQEHLLNESPSLVNLETFLVAWLSHIENLPTSRKLFDVVFFKVEKVGETKSLIEHLNEQAETDIRSLQLYLRWLIDIEEIRGDVDTELLAHSIFAFLMGHAQHWLSHADQFSLKNRALELVRLFLRGFQA